MCLVLLDLNAAFDTVNHSILLNRLKYHFGLGGKILQWTEDYLTGCTQRVIIDNDGEGEPRAESSETTLSQGVPQGSVHGPVLFSLYTAPLGDICHRHKILFHSYADNQQTYLSFKPSVANTRETCITNLQNCIDEIRFWMRVNLLKLNDSKMEFIILGTQQQLNNVPDTTIKIGEDHINPSSSVRNLGFYQDSLMKGTSHVNKLTSNLFNVLHQISKIRSKLTKEATQIVIQALVLSKLDYCNSLLLGAPDYNIRKIQRIKNFADRIVFNRSKYDHTTPLFISLHWLPVCECIVFKIAVFMYKCTHDLGPKYLQDIVVITHGRQLWSHTNNCLPVSRSNTSMTHNASFRSMGPRIWNTLYLNIINAPSLLIFKKELKTFLYKWAYV